MSEFDWVNKTDVENELAKLRGRQKVKSEDEEFYDRVSALKQKIQDESFTQLTLNNKIHEKLESIALRNEGRIPTSKLKLQTFSDEAEYQRSKLVFETEENVKLKLTEADTSPLFHKLQCDTLPISSSPRTKNAKLRPRSVKPLKSQLYAEAAMAAPMWQAAKKKTNAAGTSSKRKTKQWSNNYSVTRGDWENSIIVKLERISLPPTHAKRPKSTSIKDRSALKIQKWFKTYNRVSHLQSFAGQMLMLKRLSMHDAQQRVLVNNEKTQATADEIKRKIEAEVDTLLMRQREYEAAYFIQQTYKRRMARLDKLDKANGTMRVIPRISRRKEALKAKAFEMAQQDQAAAKLQALQRGRMCRKKNKWKIGKAKLQLSQIASCESNLTTNPRDTEALVKLAMNYYKLSENADYYPQHHCLVRMAALLNHNAILFGYEPSEVVWYTQAQAYYRTWKYEHGKDPYLLKQALFAFGKVMKGLEFTCQSKVWLQYSNILYDSGLFCGAISAFNKYIQGFTHTVAIEERIMMQLAACYFHVQELDDCARIVLEIIRTKEASNSIAQHNSSHCYTEPQSVELCDFYLILSRIYHLNGDFDGAKNAQSKAFYCTFDEDTKIRKGMTLQGFLESHFLWFRVAESMRIQRLFPFAVDAFEQAIYCSQNAPVATYYGLLSNCYHEMCSEESVTCLEKGIRVNPTDVMVQKMSLRIVDARDSLFKRELYKSVRELREYLQIIL